MLNRAIVLFGVWIAFFSLYAQEKFTISGHIRDAGNGEGLIGATVLVKEIPGTGTTTNIYGFYSLTLPEGEYTLIYSYIGYENIENPLTLEGNTKLEIELKEEKMQLNEVVITADRPDQNVTDIKMSRENLKIEKIKSMPALLGEVDIIKSIQLLPGVQTAGEGTTGMFVRGGYYDQNLILLDEATVYNASHLLGFFSVFNPDAVKNVELYKGGIPARYGGRLSSILDIQMKDGNSKRFSTSGGIGLISSRLTIEAPIKKDKASFIVSGRRTYGDLFLKLSPDPSLNNNKLYFYDLNAKANWKIDDKNQIFVSGYFGKDILGFDRLFSFDWGNATGTVRWNHLFNDRLFLNTTLLFSDFNYGFDIDLGVQNFEWKSGLQEYAAKFDFSYFINPKLTAEFGSHTIYHTFSPATITPGGESLFLPYKIDDQFALEQAFYLGLDHHMSEKIKLQYGLRYSQLYNFGKAKVYDYEGDFENVIDSTEYNRGELVNFYHGLEPRFSAMYLLNSKSSIKASYNRMMQYLQVASNSSAGFPTDRWISADSHIKPLIGDQVALGYFRNFKENMFEASVEIYYKWMQNVIDFRQGADVLLSRNLETDILSGDGRAYGAEFMIRKNLGTFTGWVSYTLSKTERKIEGISANKYYNAKYDRTHDISVVLSYDISDHVTLATNWIYATGSAVSFPVGRAEIDGKSIAIYDDDNRNAARMPAYHRLDLSATIDLDRKPRKWQSSLSFSVYNVYNRKNAFSITFEDVTNGDPNFNPDADGAEINTVEPSAVKLYLFSVIPSITYNFTF